MWNTLVIVIRLPFFIAAAILHTLLGVPAILIFGFGYLLLELVGFIFTIILSPFTLLAALFSNDPKKIKRIQKKFVEFRLHKDLFDVFDICFKGYKILFDWLTLNDKSPSES
jgi:hypothetical protein